MSKLEQNLKNYQDELKSLREQLEKHIKISQEEEVKKRKELDAFIQSANQLYADYSKEIIRLEGKIEGLMEFKEETPVKQVKDFIKSKIK